MESLVAEHLARRLRVAAGTDVRPLLWAEVNMAGFFAGYEIWLHTGGDLGSHIADARAALLDEFRSAGS